MSNILIFLLILICISAGYFDHKKSAWFIIITVPIFYPMGLYIGSDSILPLTFIRISFFLIFGIVIRNRNYLHNAGFFQIYYVKILLVFLTVLFLLQIQDYFWPTISTLIPYYLISMTLPFFLINDFKDLDRLVNILLFQATFISIFVLIEYYFSFSLYQLSLSFMSKAQLENSPDYEFIYRSGIQRVNGIYGQPVFTAFHLATIFPLSLYFIHVHKSLVKYLPFGVITIALIFLQTRASFVAIAVAILVTLILHTKSSKIYNTFFKVFTIGLILLSILMVIFPTAKDTNDIFFTNFYYSLIKGNFESETDIIYKLSSIPIALNYFYSQPVLGYLVAPKYAHTEMMRGMDLPAILLYLIGGGIVLGALYLYHLVYMFYELVKMSFNKKLNNNSKLQSLIIYSSASILIGTIVTFSVWVETQFILMYILFLSIIIVFKKRYF